jgi:hypothetical protein
MNGYDRVNRKVDSDGCLSNPRVQPLIMCMTILIGNATGIASAVCFRPVARPASSSEAIPYSRPRNCLRPSVTGASEPTERLRIVETTENLLLQVCSETAHDMICYDANRVWFVGTRATIQGSPCIMICTSGDYPDPSGTSGK